jgi:hypothetical protein
VPPNLVTGCDVFFGAIGDLDAQYGRVGPGTAGAFAGPVRRNPSC